MVFSIAWIVFATNLVIYTQEGRDPQAFMDRFPILVILYSWTVTICSLIAALGVARHRKPASIRRPLLWLITLSVIGPLVLYGLSLALPVMAATHLTDSDGAGDAIGWVMWAGILITVILYFVLPRRPVSTWHSPLTKRVESNLRSTRVVFRSPSR